MKRELPSAYLIAANSSRIGTENWWGTVILGREAIYILQERPARLPAVLLGLLLWLDEIAKRAKPQQDLTGRPYAGLPVSVRGHKDWPIPKEPSCPVLVIPRDQVEIIYHKRGPLELRFMLSGVAVTIPHGRLAGKAIRSFLWDAGWPTMWDDDRLNLPETASPVTLAQGRAAIFRIPPMALRLIGIGAAVAALPMFLYLLPHLNEALVDPVAITGFIGGLLLIILGGLVLRRGV